MAKMEGFIGKVRQDGGDVIIYGPDGAARFRVFGEYVEHAPRWVAVRRSGHVVVLDRQNLLKETIPQSDWDKGRRP